MSIITGSTAWLAYCAVFYLLVCVGLRKTPASAAATEPNRAIITASIIVAGVGLRFWFGIRDPLFWIGDTATMLLLAAVLAERRLPARSLAIYALNPLVLVLGLIRPEVFAGQLPFLAAAMWCFLGKRERPIIGVCLLAFAAALSPYILLVALLLFRRRFVRAFFLFVLMHSLFLLILSNGQPMAIPPFVMGPSLGFVTSLMTVPPIGSLLAGAEWIAIALGVFFCLCFWLLYNDAPVRCMTWCLAAVGLCIVGLTPDTALVLVVLLCLFPGRALLFLVTMSWMVYPGYDVTMAWFWIVVPFAVLAVRHPWLNDPPWHPCREAPASLDIIVPVLNEGGRIAETLAALESATDAVDMDTRIIVVDGGSSDDTVDRARAHGAHVIQCQKAGRGSQIAAGLEAGSGELVVILHADAMIRRDALQRLSNLMKSRPRLQWGVLGHVYDRSDAGMRIVELRNRLRFAYTGLAFGDQGIFVRRDILDEVGFPALRLMEDVELSLRLAPYPCRANLVDSLTVSARAWESRPLLSYPLQVSSTVIGYLFRRRLGADIRRLSNELYKKYYGRE